MSRRLALCRLALVLTLCPGASLLLAPVPAVAVETQLRTDSPATLESAQKLYDLGKFAEAAAEFERANQTSGDKKAAPQPY